MSKRRKFEHDLLKSPDWQAPLEDFAVWLDRIRGQGLIYEAMQSKAINLAADPWENQGYVDEDPPEDQ